MTKRSYICMALAIALTIGLKIYLHHTNIDNVISYADNIGAIPIIILYIVSIMPIMKRYKLGLIACTLLLSGTLLNIIVGILNKGKFPVSGYTIEQFTSITANSTSEFYIMDGYLPLLGDHACLGGMSIGDIFINTSFLIIVGIIIITYRRSKWH